MKVSAEEFDKALVKRRPWVYWCPKCGETDDDSAGHAGGGFHSKREAAQALREHLKTCGTEDVSE